VVVQVVEHLVMLLSLQQEEQVIHLPLVPHKAQMEVLEVAVQPLIQVQVEEVLLL
jgi:hypothetical protein